VPYTDDVWDSPEADFDAGQFCAVCLIDTNESDVEKVKSKCKLPIRKEPGGTIYMRAMQAAYAALRGGRGGVSDVSAKDRRKAAKALRRHYREAGMEVPDPMNRMAE
jgi:hypothetical protein